MKNFFKWFNFFACSVCFFPSVILAQAGDGSAVDEVFSAGEKLIETSQGYTVSFINSLFFFLALISMASGITLYFLSKERRKEALFLFAGTIVFASIGVLTTVWETAT